jgi:hypothetical protein
MKLTESKMDADLPEVQPDDVDANELDEQPAVEEIARLRTDFQSRLIAANLRTEAVRAGMIDLDGLKLIDLSGVRLDDNDKIVDGRKVMADLRRDKPWLFGTASTSSPADPPSSQPVQQRAAMDMTDEEYAVARAAVTKYRL